MKYLLFIYADPKQEDTPDLMRRYGEFTNAVAERGALVGGNQLKRANEATTVSVRNGRTMTTDGPYAESKEQIGGFYIVDCSTRDEAIAFAALIPNAEDGFIEVRPIVSD